MFDEVVLMVEETDVVDVVLTKDDVDVDEAVLDDCVEEDVVVFAVEEVFRTVLLAGGEEEVVVLDVGVAEVDVEVCVVVSTLVVVPTVELGDPSLDANEYGDQPGHSKAVPDSFAHRLNLSLQRGRLACACDDAAPVVDVPWLEGGWGERT